MKKHKESMGAAHNMMMELESFVELKLRPALDDAKTCALGMGAASSVVDNLRRQLDELTKPEHVAKRDLEYQKYRAEYDAKEAHEESAYQYTNHVRIALKNLLESQSQTPTYSSWSTMDKVVQDCWEALGWCYVMKDGTERHTWGCSHE